MSSTLDSAVPDAPNTLGGIVEAAEPAHPSVLGHILKSLSPGQDLTRVTIPSWFLEPRSLLERMADLFMHVDLLLDAARAPPSPAGAGAEGGGPGGAEPAALERMTRLLKWFLSGWHYKTLGVKKPYNPIVGETFAAGWKHADGGASAYLAEQVLHRPPVSAIYFENRAAGVVCTAHVWTKSQFAAPQTTKSIMDGAARLVLTGHGGPGGEEYWITLPTYYAHNLIMGTLRMEVGDTASIYCAKTGLRADVEFTQRGMFTGADKLNGVDAVVYRTPPGAAGGKKGGAPKGAAVLARVTGNWDAKLYIERAGGEKELFLDVPALPVAPKLVLPLAAQGPWESRRLWAATTAALSARPAVDWAAVDREKAQLEEEQRVLACHAVKDGAPGFVAWRTKHFHKAKWFDPLRGEEREMYEYEGFAAAVAAGPLAPGAAAPTDFLALSRDTPDPRGGRGGAGAEPDVVKATRAITLSEARKAEFAAQDAEARRT